MTNSEFQAFYLSLNNSLGNFPLFWWVKFVFVTTKICKGQKLVHCNVKLQIRKVNNYSSSPHTNKLHLNHNLHNCNCLYGCKLWFKCKQMTITKEQCLLNLILTAAINIKKYFPLRFEETE